MDVSDLAFARPEWEHIVRQAAVQLSGKGLPRPEGFPSGCYHLMRHAFGEAVHYRLYYRLTGETKATFIGRFKIIQTGVEVKRSKPAGVRPGHIIRLECGRSVMVQIDSFGLPYPVPVFES